MLIRCIASKDAEQRSFEFQMPSGLWPHALCFEGDARIRVVTKLLEVDDLGNHRFASEMEQARIRHKWDTIFTEMMALYEQSWSFAWEDTISQRVFRDETSKSRTDVLKVSEDTLALG